MKAYYRKAFLLVADAVLVNLSLYMALLLRFDGNIPVNYINIMIKSAAILTIIKIGTYYFYRLYSSLWKYASIDELIQVFFATTTESILCFIFGLATGARLPRTVYAMGWIITFLFIGGIRFSYRIGRRFKSINTKEITNFKRVMVIGAGDAGSMVIRELKNHDELKSLPIAVIDDDEKKHRANIHGVPIVGGRTKIRDIVKQENIDEIIIAMPSTSKSGLREILQMCKATKCKLKILPGVFEIISGSVSITDIRDVSIEDLLGRDEVKLYTEEIAGYLRDEIVLVTGGGGSIGSELCRQIAKYKPKKLIVFDICENGAYDLQNELEREYKGDIGLEVLIGSVRDRSRLEEVFNNYKPGVVFHAAAHKHVPLMEANPTEAVKNNVFGTLNTVEYSDKYKVKKFILVSTDKAVNPTNIMGASKRLAEMIVQTVDKQSNTEFAAVRFGNVLGSNGSVVPLFKKQIAQGGPVTVTHPEIKRFFMTIPEAAQLVIQAGAMANGGEIFILDMGEPVKIADLAKDLIRLSGFEPGEEIKIEYIGLRPGEKLCEELLLEEEKIRNTKHNQIFVGMPIDLNFNEVRAHLNLLENNLSNRDRLIECMEKVVTTYNSGRSEKSNISRHSDIIRNIQSAKKLSG